MSKSTKNRFVVGLGLFVALGVGVSGVVHATNAPVSQGADMQKSEMRKQRAHQERRYGLHGDLNAAFEAVEGSGPVSMTVCAMDPMALRGHEGACGINETQGKTYCKTCGGTVDGAKERGPAGCTVTLGACKTT